VTRIVVVSAGLSQPSSTRLLADRLATATAALDGDAQVEVIELRDLAPDHLLTGFALTPFAEL
jgi:FMN reductase